MTGLKFTAGTADMAVELSALHSQVLAGMLTRLGPVVVQKFYENTIADGLGQVTCASRDDELAGFVLTAADEDRVLRKALIAGAKDYVWMLRHARKLQLLSTIAAQLAGRSRPTPAGTSLLYIGVRESERGSGLSTELLRAAESRLQAEKIESYWLRVRCDNAAAINFYFKNGFRADDFERESTQLVLMKDISGSGGSD